MDTRTADRHPATRAVRVVVPLLLVSLVALIDYEFFSRPLPPTIQPLEILWTEFSLIGLCFQARGLVDALLDYSSLRRDGRNGARKIVAWNGIRNQTNACVMHLLFMAIGVVAMTQAPPSPDQPVTLTGVVLTVVLFGANALLVTNAILQRRARSRLEAYLAQTEAATLKGAIRREQAGGRATRDEE